MPCVPPTSATTPSPYGVRPGSGQVQQSSPSVPWTSRVPAVCPMCSLRRTRRRVRREVHIRPALVRAVAAAPTAGDLLPVRSAADTPACRLRIAHRDRRCSTARSRPPADRRWSAAGVDPASGCWRARRWSTAAAIARSRRRADPSEAAAAEAAPAAARVVLPDLVCLLLPLQGRVRAGVRERPIGLGRPVPASMRDARHDALSDMTTPASAGTTVDSCQDPCQGLPPSAASATVSGGPRLSLPAFGTTASSESTGAASVRRTGVAPTSPPGLAADRGVASATEVGA